MKESFLCDTYALIEISKGNPNYKKYINKNLYTSMQALIELYYFMLRVSNEHEANSKLITYSRILTPISMFTIREAMLFKFKNRKEQLSYVDCVGYALAKELNIPFLTGDKHFKNKENVEFVR